MADAWAVVEALAADEARGAAQIAERAAAALPDIASEEIADAIEVLLAGHPEMAPLWRLASDVLFADNPSSGAERFLERLRADDKAAELLAVALPDRVLTISYSSMVERAIRLRRPVALLCMASEPGGEGQRMADALEDAVDVTVIPDEDALADVPAEGVVVGADALTPTSVVNKLGTAALTAAARERDVPCFVVAGETKLVPEELPVEGPFEPAPLGAFAAVAMPNGLLTPTEAAARAAAVELHPALRALIARFDEVRGDEADADTEESAS